MQQSPLESSFNPEVFTINKHIEHKIMLKYNFFVEIMDELDSIVMRWNYIIEVIEMTDLNDNRDTRMKGREAI
ncbi:hypothetical protein BBB02_04440 [Wolbachia endosymbiont of Bemisia tabaci]|nr:hypothetical protein BBB02_04440 [Wolbachia endosymbiont of Bemisia tabaci]